MARFIPIQKTLHKEMGFSRTKDFFFAAQDSVAPVLVEELSHVMTSLPLCFVENGNGGYTLAVLQSFIGGKNFLVHPSGKWFSGYIPSHYRGYPFALLPDSDSGRLTLCFNEESGLLRENPFGEDIRFFDENGETSQFTKNVLQFLELRKKGLETTQAVVDTIAKAGIITPWKISIKDASGNDQMVEGLYKIDEAKLNSLSDEEFVGLKPVLGVIYTILLSEHRISNLTKLFDLHKQIANNSGAAKEDFDLDKFFEEQNDTLSF